MTSVVHLMKMAHSHSLQEDLLAGASDANNDSLTATNLVLSGRASLTDNGDGTYIITPEDNFNGDLHLRYDVTDSMLSTAAKMDLTVNAVNDATELRDHTSTMYEDRSVVLTQERLLSGARDADWDDLTVESVTVTNDTGVIIENDDGTFTFRPTYNLGNTEAELEYTVSDGTTTSTASYTFNINSVSDPARLMVKAIDVNSPGEMQSTADFSEAESAVLFDITKQTAQAVGGGLRVGRWDATEVTGSDYDDVFMFKELEAGESYTINGGSGNNTINLDEYRGDQVTIDTNTNTITVDVDGEGNTATINYSDIDDFDFRTDVFDGTPHGVRLNDFPWTINGTELHADSTGVDSYAFAVALVDFEGSLAEDFTLDVEVNATVTSGALSNGSILFDYQDENNYKMVGVKVDRDEWTIEEVINGERYTRQTLSESIPADTDVPFSIEVEGSLVTVVSEGVSKVSHDFGEPLNDGPIGVFADKSNTTFKLNMAPSNWAPSVVNYDVEMGQKDGSYLTANVLEEATDPQDEVLTIAGFSQGENGSVTDNGDGTFTYTPNDGHSGLDSFTYEVSDGTNTTTGTVRINVVANTVLEIDEGGEFEMEVAAELVDVDGSETLVVTLDGNPVGSVVTDGTNTFTVTEDEQSVTITDWDLTQVSVTPPENFVGWFKSTDSCPGNRRQW